MTHPVLAAVERLDDDFNFFSSSGRPPEAATVAALEAELGRPLPASHRALVEACGCAAVIVKDEVWPPPVAYEIRPAWQMIRGIEIFGVAPPGHPLSITGRTAELHGRGADPGLLALARPVGGGPYLCATAAGDLVWWRADGSEPAGDFADAIVGFLDQLAQDKDRIKREGVQRS